MAISFVGVSTNTTADLRTPMTVSLPSGSASTDVLVAVVYFTATTLGTLNAPSGWTLLTGSNLGPNNIAYIQVYTSIGNTAGTSWSLTGGSTAISIIEVTAWRGVDNGTPVRTSSVIFSNSSSADHPAPSITPNAGDAVFAFWIQAQNTGVAMGAAPAGYTDATLNLQSGTLYDYTSSYNLSVGAGATGTLSHNTNIAFLASYLGTIALAGVAANPGYYLSDIIEM